MGSLRFWQGFIGSRLGRDDGAVADFGQDEPNGGKRCFINGLSKDLSSKHDRRAAIEVLWYGSSRYDSMGRWRTGHWLSGAVAGTRALSQLFDKTKPNEK
jgi:hypothetical protein